MTDQLPLLIKRQESEQHGRKPGGRSVYELSTIDAAKEICMDAAVAAVFIRYRTAFSHWKNLKNSTWRLFFVGKSYFNHLPFPNALYGLFTRWIQRLQRIRIRAGNVPPSAPGWCRDIVQNITSESKVFDTPGFQNRSWEGIFTFKG